MKRYHAKNFESIALTGFTDVFVLTNSDLTTTATNTTQAVALTSLSVGDFVFADLFVEVITAATGLATCTMSVGVTGAATNFIAAQDMIAGNLYFANASTVAPYATIATGKSLIATFTPGASEALSACTALEVRIWAQISRVTQRQVIQL